MRDAMKYEYDMDDPLVYNNEMGRYKLYRVLNFIKGFLEEKELKILDIGGGNGRLAIPLAGLDQKVTVIDLSESAIGYLAKRKITNIRGVHSDILFFKTLESFDLALAIDVIKYIPTSVSLEQLFSKVNSLLALNGLLVLAEINKASWRNHLSVLLSEAQQYNTESANGYRIALETSGFEIEKMSGFVWMPFRNNSDSSLVRVFKKIEDAINLQAWISQSPWLLIAARKNKEVSDPFI